MTVREFWRSTSLGPQLALACTLAAGIVNLWSYVGLTWPAAYLVHLAVMALGFALFGRLVQHHRLARKERRARDWPFDREARMRRFITPLPTLLVWGVIAALVYMAGVAIRDSAVFGEGAAEFRDGQEVWVNNGVVVRKLAPGSVANRDASMLRVFSAAWLFFGLVIALWWHRIDERIEGYRASLQSPGG